MTIKQTKERISEIPENQDANPIWYNITEYGICSVGELKTLARSHSKLLKTAKAAMRAEGFVTEEFTALEVAIKEAEA